MPTIVMEDIRQVTEDLTDQFLFELQEGLRVSVQADTARGHFSTRGEVIYVSNHHFRVACDIRVPENALKPKQEMRLFIEGKGGGSPILSSFIRVQEEGSHVLILGLPSGSLHRNRRAFFRGELEVPVALKRKSGDIFHGTAKNISGGGLLVTLNQPLQKNEELEADILFSEQDVITAHVRAVRIVEHEDGTDHGFKFTDIRRRDQDRICRIVIVREFESRRAEIRELNENVPQRP